MARRLGITVANDFRSADVLAGGQGAPLAASYHAALLRFAGATPNAAVLNLGGVANVTWWGGGDDVFAFDTGPANAPLNDWVHGQGLGEMDGGGALAVAAQWTRAALPHSCSIHSFRPRHPSPWTDIPSPQRWSLA
jgi:anhydro-N-acetylmuramic acid kinase